MAKRMLLALVGALLLVASPLPGAGASHDFDHSSGCEPSDQHVELLTTPFVLVYFYGGRRASEFVGCHRSTERHHLLADPGDDRYMFSSPVAMSARRSFVGYAVRDAGRTVVEVRDVSEPPPVGWPCVGCGTEQPEPLRRFGATYHPRRSVGVETLKIGRDQALAWTTCRLGGKSYGGWAYDECPQSYGARVRVWRARAGRSKIELLDQGRRIYPRTLRIDGGRIYWRSGERTRSAKL